MLTSAWSIQKCELQFVWSRFSMTQTRYGSRWAAVMSGAKLSMNGVRSMSRDTARGRYRMWAASLMFFTDGRPRRPVPPVAPSSEIQRELCHCNRTRGFVLTTAIAVRPVGLQNAGDAGYSQDSSAAVGSRIRYPMPGSVSRSWGRAGSASILARSWAMNTRRY